MRTALQAESPCIPSYPSAGSAAAGASLEIPKFARCLPPPEGWRFPPPVPIPAAGGEPAGSEVERGVAGCGCPSVCLCAISFVSGSPCSAVHPAGGRPRIPAPRIPSPPSPARHTQAGRASARPRRPPRQIAGLITSRGLIASRALEPPPAPHAALSRPRPGWAAAGRPALPRPSGRAVPAVPAGRLCASGPRLAVPAGPAPSWLPGMNMHGPPSSSSSSSCMCVCVCGERGSASSAAPAMSARLRLGPP